MDKREYIKANKDWLEAKAKEEGVKALPKGIYAWKYSNIIWYFARLFVSLQPLNIDIWNSEK
jgi:hypothetical protein